MPDIVEVIGDGVEIILQGGTNVVEVLTDVVAGGVLQTTADLRYLRSGLLVVGDLCNSIGINGTLSYYNSSQGAIGLGAISYFAYALPKTKGRFRYGGNAGHVGWTSTQIITDYLPTAMASNWDYVHLQVMTNDIGAGFTFAQTQANVIYMVTQLLSVGKTPILCTMPPLGPATGFNTGAGLTLLTKLNLWVKRYAEAMHLPCVDYHTVCVNPSNNAWLAGYANADDIHPVSLGAQAMGNALAEVLNAIPGFKQNPLIGAYNPNMMLPDAVITSALSDKWTSAGPTTGGWAFKAVTSSAFFKGTSWVVTRGTGGDYQLFGPIASGLWVAGHRVRVACAFDASNVPASGTWSVYLYNVTQLQAICGYTAIPYTMTNKSVTVTDGTTTSGSKVISSPSAPFRPTHVGCTVSSAVGVTAGIAAGTTIVGVSMDGTQAQMSANASATASGTAVITVSGEPCIMVFEFDVQADMVGDDIRLAVNIGGAAGCTVGVAQATVQDITALGIAV
jgi:lysophospholipase L1-like esterase